MRETITSALKTATKAQDKRRVSTLRLVSAAIKDRDIAAVSVRVRRLTRNCSSFSPR